jgi:hypothetical protein
VSLRLVNHRFNWFVNEGTSSAARCYCFGVAIGVQDAPSWIVRIGDEGPSRQCMPWHNRAEESAYRVATSARRDILSGSAVVDTSGEQSRPQSLKEDGAPSAELSDEVLQASTPLKRFGNSRDPGEASASATSISECLRK